MIATLVASAVIGMTPNNAPVDWLGIFTANAVQTWGAGQLPPCGPIRYAWAPPATENATAEAHVDTSNGAAQPCTVRWNPAKWEHFTLNPGAMCIEILHEVGHLYGHDHEEGGVMAMGDAKFHHWRTVAPSCARLVKTGWRCRRTRGEGIACKPYAMLRAQAEAG